MNTKILITGVTGNVGREVIRLFPGKEHLRAAVTDIQKAPLLLGEGIERIHFNFEDRETYAAAFENVRAVFLVRPPAISNVKKYIAPVIDAAKAGGVEHIVFLSLIGVEKNRFVPHHKIEKYIRESGIDWTFLRTSFFMQNLNTTHRKEIQAHSEINVPVGNGKTSFIDVRDIAAVAVHALTQDSHRNRSYTLTGSEALDYYQVAQIMSAILGRQIHYANPSIMTFIRQQLTNHRPLNFTLIMTALYTLTRLGTAKDVTSETSSLLGRPAIRFDQYVNDYRESWV